MDNSNEAKVSQHSDEQWINDHLAVLRQDGDWQPDLSRGSALLRVGVQANRGRRRKLAWVSAVAVVAGAPLMALPVTQAIAQRCVSACAQESSRLRAFLLGTTSSPAPSSKYVKPEDRKMAPDFTVSDSSGKVFKLSDFRGKAILLNFWATWCGPCAVEIPMLKDLQQTYQQRNFTVLGISLEEEGWSVVRPYMERVQFNYPVLMGGDDIAGLYGGLDAIPTTLLIDNSGRIASLHVGLCNRGEYEGEIKALLKEH